MSSGERRAKEAYVGKSTQLKLGQAAAGVSGGRRSLNYSGESRREEVGRDYSENHNSICEGRKARAILSYLKTCK